MHPLKPTEMFTYCPVLSFNILYALIFFSIQFFTLFSQLAQKLQKSIDYLISWDPYSHVYWVRAL